MDSNLSYYKIFYTVARTGNISAAAKELFISQPAISKSIQKLEENLSVTLFTRNSRGVALTEDGAVLFHYISSAFETLRQAEEELQKRTALGIGHLKIGVSTTLCRHMLLPLLKDFIKQHPHIKITIDCQSTNKTLSLLEQEKIDIGLVAKPEKRAALHFHSLGKIEDIFVATETYMHNLSLRETTNTADIFENATLMLLDKDNMTRKYIDNYIGENSIQTSDLIEISSMELLIEFAKINLGIACVVKEFVKTELDNGTFIELPLSRPIPKREVGFVYLKTRNVSDSLKSFLKAMGFGE